MRGVVETGVHIDPSYARPTLLCLGVIRGFSRLEKVVSEVVDLFGLLGLSLFSFFVGLPNRRARRKPRSDLFGSQTELVIQLPSFSPPLIATIPRT